MRKTHPLSEETIKVMSGYVADIAEEMDVSPQYVHGILSGVNADRFAQFSHDYAACLRAGAPIEHWDNRLKSIRTKYDQHLCLDTARSKSVKEDADCIIAHYEGKSLYDQLNEVDEAIREKENLRTAILKAINQEKDEFGGGRTRLQAHRAVEQFRSK